MELMTFAVKLYVPTAVGVPDSVPPAEKLVPGGTVPKATENVYTPFDPYPPSAPSVPEYGRPTTPLPRLPVKVGGIMPIEGETPRVAVTVPSSGTWLATWTTK